MRLVFYSNYLNIHQVFLMDAFYDMLGDDFCFVATMPKSTSEQKGGMDYSSRPYCISASESENCRSYAMLLAREADTCVFGACSQDYAVERAISNRYGLSFEMGERWFKHGVLTIGSPVFRKWLFNYFRYYRKANFYKLCCSSFTAKDDTRIYAYLNRHYKWGYFTAVPDVVTTIQTEYLNLQENQTLSIMWCARFLKLKHPEMPVLLAAKLKNEGYNFVINIYGDDKNLLPANKVYSSNKLRRLIENLDVADVVNLKGSCPNVEILDAMKTHDIFLFTSDRNEGWGAVANEAMSNKCCLVASDAIGSTHYLLRDGENGLIFKSGSVDSLYEKVKYLLDNPCEREVMAERGFQDIFNIWSPKAAAKNLIQLISDINNGLQTFIYEGPCSKA